MLNIAIQKGFPRDFALGRLRNTGKSVQFSSHGPVKEVLPATPRQHQHPRCGQARPCLHRHRFARGESHSHGRSHPGQARVEGRGRGGLRAQYPGAGAGVGAKPDPGPHRFRDHQSIFPRTGAGVREPGRSAGLRGNDRFDELRFGADGVAHPAHAAAQCGWRGRDDLRH